MAGKQPHILVTTCMKNEGPFILEWLAWHLAIGVTDIVVFSNDCTDGTDALLDHLAYRGVLRHLPNPAVTMGSTSYQPLALKFTQEEILPMENYDYVISMDVDEFINIRVRNGLMSDLLESSPDFDVLTMTELNHGCNGHVDYEDRWLTETFPLHQKEMPNQKNARRGVKSIVRVSEKLQYLRNHRPETTGDAIWLDGSGRANDVMRDENVKGLDCRGTYDLVVLEHFALRSLHSYLVKMHRGDVVKSHKRVTQRYWRVRNRNGFQTSDMSMGAALARAYFNKHFRPDEALMSLHAECVEQHRRTIAALLKVDDFIERKNWILDHAWHGVPVVT